MPERCPPFASVFITLQAMGSRPPRTARTAGKVTVLLFLLATHRIVYAEQSQEGSLRLFQFRCEFRMPIAPGRVDGWMASNGRQHRIAIYWIEPAMFREAPTFVRCCDLIFDGDAVHYWIHGIPERGTFSLSDGEKDALLPVQKSAESVLRSALAVLKRIGCPGDDGRVPLELATFFQRSRGQAHYNYGVSPNEVADGQSFDSADSGAQILNALGREYSKESQDDGSMVWRAQRAATGPPVVGVTIRRVHEFEQDALRAVFDVETLGQWTLLREAYRAYWSFARALETMSVSSDVRTSARDLHGRLDSYLDQNNVPAEVGRALDRLRFQAALMTADSNCVWQSAQAVVTGLCTDDTIPKERSLTELGSMSARIQERYPERMEEQLRPLVAVVVRHGGQDAATGVERLMVDIMNNAWFTYGELLVSEMRRAGLMDQRDADSCSAKLHASRLARGGIGPDPCDATPTVQRYLAQLDADPSRGTLDMDDIRRILNEGLAQRYTAGQSEAKREVVENTIRSIRLIAGEGPFCADPEKLIPALDRLSANCLPVNNGAGSSDSLLATFLGLSFCDTSTGQDHERLFSQLQSCSRTLESQVNAMLAARGLGVLVTPEDVERRFQAYERRFQQYMDDPLWPPFKFPWTRDEEVRLDGALRLQLTQLETAFDAISLKVKYGGASDELEGNTLRAVSRAARQLLWQAALLRAPPYPGVVCRYVGGSGFSIVIRRPLYQEGHRPRERFQAMKYFHLGRRLQSVVERERELTRHAEQEETSK